MTTLEITGIAILSVLILCSAIQYIFYWFIFTKPFSIKNKTSEACHPVSIVVCARNEEANLRENLPLLLEQEYPDYEVVVVNDCSSDDSDLVLKALAAQYPRLRYTTIKEDEKFQHGKKLALTVGIKAAKNEWMLMTDADCKPSGPHWLSTMASQMTEDKSIVLGYGGYLSQSGFVNKLIRFETAWIALQYISLAIVGNAYMGVGRNLSYRKSLFFANKGFASHARLLSGDDDLFINETATATNVSVQFLPEAHTYSKPKKSLSEWIEQKSRHFQTYPQYKFKHKFLLTAETISRVAFYFSLAALLILQQYIWVALALLFVRLVSQVIVLNVWFKKLNEKKLFLLSLIFDVVMPFLYFIIYLTKKFKPARQWR